MKTPVFAAVRNAHVRPRRMYPTVCRAMLAGLIFAAAACSAAADEQRLTTDGRFKSDPVFVDRSGAELVFVVQERPVQLQLLRLTLADLSVAVLHPDQTKSEFEPAFSPDGKIFSFVQSRGNLSLSLQIVDATANRESEVPPAGGFAGPHTPAVSPDGSRVIFSFPDEGRQRLYTVNVDGSDRRVLIDSEGVNISPSFAPDGSQIVFSSTRDDDYEIYSADSDGSDVRRLTRSPRQDLRPRYSPDGSRIAFTSNRDGNYEVYVMHSNGTGVVRVTRNPERDDYPAWHPDGKRLVIVSERAGRHDLYLIDVPHS